MTKVRRHKLLFAIDSLHGGGAERMLCQIAGGLDPARHEVQIALTLGLDQDFLPPAHVGIVRLPQRIPADLVSGINPEIGGLETAMARRLGNRLGLARDDNAHREELLGNVSAFRTMTAMFARQVRAWSPDCIMSFLPNSNMIALLARLWYRLPVPLLCSDRNHLSSELPRLPWHALRASFTRLHYPAADAHIAVAPAVADDLHRAFGVPRNRIRTILNGVDHERLRALAAQDDALPKFSADNGCLHLIAVGRLSEQKGFDLLLRALARLRQRPWRLVLLGDGELRDSLAALASQLGIADRIQFAGWQANPYAWMARSDVMVSCSRWEGMPNALLEAMALGLPVVATDCPSGPRLLLDDGRAGRLVDNDSIDALAAGISELLALTTAERQQLGERAARRSLSFGLGQTVEAYRQLLEAAIARRFPLGDPPEAR